MLHSLSIQWNKMTVLIGRSSIHLQIPYRMPTIATKKHSSSNAKALDDVTTLCQHLTTLKFNLQFWPSYYPGLLKGMDGQIVKSFQRDLTRFWK